MVTDQTANPFKAHSLPSALPIGMRLIGTLLMGVVVARNGSTKVILNQPRLRFPKKRINTAPKKLTGCPSHIACLGS